MRTFIAVEIGDEAREALGRYLEDLRERVPGVRWSTPGNVHLTLRFLGEVADAMIPAVARAAREAACRTAPFSLSLGKPASFGGRSPRVLLIQINGDVEALARLQGRLEDQLESAGLGAGLQAPCNPRAPQERNRIRDVAGCRPAGRGPVERGGARRVLQHPDARRSDLRSPGTLPV